MIVLESEEGGQLLVARPNESYVLMLQLKCSIYNRICDHNHLQSNLVKDPLSLSMFREAVPV